LLTLRTARSPAGSQATHSPTAHVSAWRRYPRLLYGSLLRGGGA